MGYDTTFDGEFKITPQLKPEHAAYLRKFSQTRRMKRNEFKTVDMPDPIRKAVGLPVGTDGQFFVGSTIDYGQAHTSDVVDYNNPPAEQPSLWCQWEPDETGDNLRAEGEKFYEYSEWLQYLIDNFFAPWGYTLEGIVRYQGEDPGDFGRIRVDGGDTVVVTKGKRVW